MCCLNPHLRPRHRSVWSTLSGHSANPVLRCMASHCAVNRDDTDVACENHVLRTCVGEGGHVTECMCVNVVSRVSALPVCVAWKWHCGCEEGGTCTGELQSMTDWLAVVPGRLPQGSASTTPAWGEQRGEQGVPHIGACERAVPWR